MAKNKHNPTRRVSQEVSWKQADQCCGHNLFRAKQSSLRHPLWRQHSQRSRSRYKIWSSYHSAL